MIFVLVSFLALIGYLYIYYSSVTDSKNIVVKGFVYDLKTNKPLENVAIQINNERYENDRGHTNYDEYLGHDVFYVNTDSTGYFNKKIPKSAFLRISFSKSGYVDYIQGGEDASKLMEYKIKMKKLDN